MDVSAQQGSVLGMHVSPSLLRAPNVPDGYSSDIVPFARVLKHFSAFVVRDIEGLALGLTVGAIVGESLGDKEGIEVGGVPTIKFFVGYAFLASSTVGLQQNAPPFVN